jgi:acetyl esterase/lipase
MKDAKYPIEKEYLAVPEFKMRPNRLLMMAVSTIMALPRLFFRWDKRVKAVTHRIRPNKGVGLKVIKIQPKKLNKDSPALVYYHGGAFFLTYMVLHMQRAQDYAIKAGIRVFLVDYRLSTRHPFPAAIDDCYNALKWVYDNASMLGVRTDQISVGGDSAGGALAASVAQMARDRNSVPIKAQHLIYPVIDSDCKTKSATEFVDTPIFTAAGNRIMWDIYLRASNYKRGKHRPRYASPIHCDNFKNLPTAYIESAEYDPLRDEAKDYAEALKAAGVKVHFLETKGTIHGYDYFKNSPTTKKYYAERLRHIMLYSGKTKA